MEEYLRQELPIGALAAVLARSRVFTALSAATPGMRELLKIGKVWELAQSKRRTRGSRPYDPVVLDAPATGHGLAMLQAPARSRRSRASARSPRGAARRAVCRHLGAPPARADLQAAPRPARRADRHAALRV
jgi:anion-transporting  ArsA/GET3 family ATPase